MNSHIPIPGLGQLDPNGTPPTLNAIDESHRANVTRADTEMTDADNIHPGSDKPEIESVQGTLITENTKEEGAAVTVDHTAEAHHVGQLAQHDSTEDTKMQNSSSHENTGQTRAENAATEPEEQGIEMNTSISEPQDQQASEEKSPPASPRVTDALEAALDGLLGPVTEDTGSKDQTAPTDEQSEQQPSNEIGQVDASPIPNNAPAEDDANANAEWEADSSPYESSSSDSSDDSSDDDESDVEESKLGVEETARLLMEADGGSDDEMDGPRAAKQAAGVRTKNEQPDEPEPRPEIHIDENDTIAPLGIVQHVVEGTQVVIEALRDGNAVTILDRGTVLCKEDRTVVGLIHDTIATVHKPMYILQFRSQEEAKEIGLERGAQIWFPKSRAKFVFPSQLRLEKGSDASNLHDEEVGPDEIEYSDDEQEQAHKREKKNRKRAKGKFHKGDDNESRAPTTYGDSNPRYDDDDDGPYKPLARPANFGTGLPPVPPPGVSPFPPAHVPRGGQNHQNRRGGDFRGRGGRGRGFNGRGRGGHGQQHNNHQAPAQPQNSHQPPPPFATNPPPVPGQWPFPIPPMPQFGGAAPPPNPGAPNPSYPMPSWGAAQPNPFPFPPVPLLPNWPNTAQQPPQQAHYSQPAGGYNMPLQYSPNGATSPPLPVPAPAPNNYQYPNYYGGGAGGGGGGGQAQNGQSQRWG